MVSRKIIMGESVGSVGEILAQITVGILQIAHNISPNVSLSLFTGEPEKAYPGKAKNKAGREECQSREPIQSREACQGREASQS